MAIIDSYIQFLQDSGKKGIPTRFPAMVIPGKNNKPTDVGYALRKVRELSSLLRENGIPLSVTGSASVHMLTKTQLKSHDIDFIINLKDIDSAKSALISSGYDFWREDFIHRNMRNMTGGFGRHHNYGLSSPYFLQDNGLPVWIGLFAYQAKDSEISFSEYFAISEFKVRLLLSQLKVQRPDIPEEVFGIFDINHKTLSLTINKLSECGIDFWAEINRPQLNSIDMQRRNSLMSLERSGSGDHKVSHVENFLEFRMTTTYNISAEDYLFSRAIDLCGEVVLSVPLEISYLRYSKLSFAPHFLGQRDKYAKSAQLIERIGQIDAKQLDKFRQAYETQQKVYETAATYTFVHDVLLDPKALRTQLNNGMRAEREEPNYLSLLLEGTHYVLGET